MTPEELIEAEAEWLEQLILSVQNAALKYHETGEITAFNSNTIALAHFKALNSWGVRLINPYTDPDWSSKDRMRVRPLPEAQTLKALTFNQAIVELGKAHRTEAK